MDFLVGFTLGYFCKEIFSYLKKLSNNKKVVYCITTYFRTGNFTITLDDNEKHFRDNVQELHSRITTNAKETTQHMSEMERRLQEEFSKLRGELSNRVGVLEKWKWVIIGGSIVAGFILQKIISFQI